MAPVFSMKIVSAGDAVSVTGMTQLVAENADQFRLHVGASLFAWQRCITVDMRDVTRMDNSGLQALLSFQALLRNRNGVMRLINANRAIEPTLELILANASREFEVVAPACGGNEPTVRESGLSALCSSVKVAFGSFLAQIPVGTSLLQLG